MFETIKKMFLNKFLVQVLNKFNTSGEGREKI